MSLMSQAGNLNREVYLVTDRQRESLPEKPLLDDARATVYLVDLQESDNTNVGLTGVDFGGQLVMPGHEFTVTATVRNYSSQAIGDQIASLFLNGRRMSQTGFSCGAGADGAVRLTATIPQIGFFSGYVEIPDDMLADDNRYYFSFNVPDRFSVLLIDADPSASFIDLALAPSPDQQMFWSVKRVTPDRLGEVNIGDYHAVVMAGIPNLPMSVVLDIRTSVNRGKGLLLVYGERTDPAAANQNWGDVAGFNIESPAPVVTTRAGYYSLKSVQADHPIFSVFGFTSESVPDLKFYSLPKMAAVDSARILMRFSGDRPALIENTLGSGKILTFCGPIGPEYSDMVSQGFFVPFVSRIVEYLSSNLSSFETRLFTGENVTRAVAPGTAITTSLDMIAPDSSSWGIVPEENGGSMVVHPIPTKLPGSYSLTYRGREIDRFALNVNPKECDLTTVDREQLSTAVGAPDAKVIPTSGTVSSAVAGFRIGRELWPIFAWLAVILLAIEMVLGRGAAASEEE
jgi:hypothetical protein